MLSYSGSNLINQAGDPASGLDTMCQDACQATLGLSCDQIVDSYFKASNTDTNDFFGVSVSLSAHQLLVGAKWEASCANRVNPRRGMDPDNNNCETAGAAYTYRVALEVSD